LDDFKLSKISLKYLQIFCFISILFSPLVYYYFLDYFLDYFININLYFDDKNKNDINLHEHVTIDKDAAKIIGISLKNVGHQIDLGASITGVGGAVAKGIAKYSRSPL
jgi:hypothetical protein